MFRLLPKEEKYFDLFNQMTVHIKGCTALLQKLFAEDVAKHSDYADQIKKIEHDCDEITHDIVRKLNQTFITPIDREDIHAIASKLDDIVDNVEYTSRRVVLFRVGAPTTDHALRLTSVLIRQAEQLEKAVNALAKNNMAIIQDCIIAIHTLENEGDAIHYQALGQLFAEEKDPITLIKWKEVYETLERSIDKCEDVANIIEAVMLKNA